MILLMYSLKNGLSYKRNDTIIFNTVLMNLNPLVSVVLPTKNGNATIRRALQSVASQTYKNMEIIIVDDNEINSEPSIELRTIVSNSGARALWGDAVKVIQGSVKGPGVARDFAIRSTAQGELIAFIDDDDAWSDVEKIERQVLFLRRNPEIKLTGAEKTIFIDEHGRVLKEIMQPTTQELAYRQMLMRNPLITSSVLMYKDTYIASGGFPPTYLAEEYELWLKIGRQVKPFPIANTPNTTISYTVRKNSASNTNKVKMARVVLGLVLKNFLFYPNNVMAVAKAELRVLKALLGK